MMRVRKQLHAFSSSSLSVFDPFMPRKCCYVCIYLCASKSAWISLFYPLLLPILQFLLLLLLSSFHSVIHSFFHEVFFDLTKNSISLVLYAMKILVVCGCDCRSTIGNSTMQFDYIFWWQNKKKTAKKNE